MEEQSFVVPRVPQAASLSHGIALATGSTSKAKATNLLTLGTTVGASVAAVGLVARSRKGRKAVKGAVKRHVLKKVVEVPEVTDVEKGLGLTNFNPETWTKGVISHVACLSKCIMWLYMARIQWHFSIWLHVHTVLQAHSLLRGV